MSRRYSAIFAPGDIEVAQREYVAIIDAWCTRVHTRERREEVAVPPPGSSQVAWCTVSPRFSQAPERR